MSYIKNLSRSFMYAAPTVLQEKFKGISNIIAAADSEQLSELKGNLKEARGLIEKESGSTFSEALKKSKQRLSSGKLYESNTASNFNKRLDSSAGMSDEDFGFTSGDMDDDDFGFGDDADLGIEDVSESPKDSVVNSISDYASAEISNASLEGASMIASTTSGAALSVSSTLIKSTVAQIEAVKEAAQVNRAGFSTLNEFNAKMFGIQSDILDTLSDIDSKLETQNSFNAGELVGSNSPDRVTADSLFNAQGQIQLGAYSKLLVEKTSDFIKGDMFKMASAYLSDPIARGVEVGMGQIFDSKHFSVFRDLSDTIGALPMMMFGKLEKWRDSDNKVIAKLADFLSPDKMNAGFKTGQYERGPIPFDGVTKRAITQVVPNLLSKILAAITGQGSAKELIYDYENGKFNSREEAKNENIRDTMHSNLQANFGNDISALTDGREFDNNKDLKAYEDKISNMFDTIASKGLLFNDVEQYLSSDLTGSDEYAMLKGRYDSMTTGQKSEFNRNMISYSNSKAHSNAMSQDDEVLQQLYGDKGGIKPLEQDINFSDRVDATLMKKDILDKALQVKIVDAVPLGVYLVKKDSIEGLRNSTINPNQPSGGDNVSNTSTESDIPKSGRKTEDFNPNMGTGRPEGSKFESTWSDIAKDEDGKVTVKSILGSPIKAAAKSAQNIQDSVGKFLFGADDSSTRTSEKRGLFGSVRDSFDNYFKIFIHGKDHAKASTGSASMAGMNASSIESPFKSMADSVKGFIKDKIDMITEKMNNVVSYLFNGDDSVFGKLKTSITDNVITPVRDFATEKVWKPVKEFTTNTFESIADYGHNVFASTKEYFFGENGLFINMQESINANIIQPAKDQLAKFGDNLKTFVWGTEEEPGIARHAFNEFNSAITFPIRDFFMDEKDGVLVKFKNSAIELVSDVKSNLMGEPKKDADGNPITLMSSISTGIADKLFGEDHEVSSPKDLFIAVADKIGEKMAPIIDPMKTWVKDRWTKASDFMADGAGKVNDWMSEKIFQPAGDFVKDKIFAPMNTMLFDEESGLFAKGKTFFNDYLFGSGENSFYSKVLQPAGTWVNNSIIAPFQRTWTESIESIKGFFSEQFIKPMGDQVFQPFIKEFQFVVTDFKDQLVESIQFGFKLGTRTLNEGFEKVFGQTVGDMLEEKVVDPIRKSLDGIRTFIGGFFKKAINTVMNPIREKAENLKAKHIKSNLSRSGYVNEKSAKKLLEDGRISYEDYSNWKLNRTKHLNKGAIKEEEKLRKAQEREQRMQARMQRHDEKANRRRNAAGANDFNRKPNEPDTNGFTAKDQTVHRKDDLGTKADRAQIKQVSILDSIYETLKRTLNRTPQSTENVGGQGDDTIFKDSNVTNNKTESFTDRRVKNESNDIDIESVSATINDEVADSVNSSNDNLELLYLKSISSETSDIMTFMKKNLRNVDANTRGILKALGGKKAVAIADTGKGDGFIMGLIKAPFRMFGNLMGTTGDIAKNLLIAPFKLMSGIATNFGKVITGAMSAVTKFVGGIADAGKHLISIVGTIGQGIADGIKGLITNAGQILTNLTKTVGDTIVKGVEGIGNIVNSSINVIGNAATSFGEVITKTAIPAISSLASTTIDAASSIAKSVLGVGKDLALGVAGIAGGFAAKFDKFREVNKIQKVYVTGGYLDGIRKSIASDIQAANDDTINPNVKRLPIVKSTNKAEPKRGKTADAISLERKKEKVAKVVNTRQNLMLTAQQSTAAATTSMDTGFGKIAGILMMLPAMLKNLGTMFMGSKAAGLGMDALGTAGDLLGGKGKGVPTGGKLGKMGKLSGWFKNLVTNAPDAMKRTKDSLMTAKAASNSNFMKSLTKVGKTGGIAIAGLVGEMAADALSDGMADGDAKQIVKSAGTAMSYAGIGATIGSFIPGLGTALGAGIGGALGIVVENFDSITKATGEFFFGGDAQYDDKGKLVNMRKPNLLARSWATLFGNDVEYDAAGNVIRYQSDSIFGKFGSALFGSDAEFDADGNLIQEGQRNLFGTIGDFSDKMGLWWDDFSLDFSIGMTNFKDSLMTKAEDFASGIGDFFSGIGDKVSGLMSGIKNTAKEFWNSDDKIGYASETASKVGSSIADTASSTKDSVLGWFGMSKADDAYEKFSGDVVEAKALTLFEEYKKGERYQQQLAKIAKYKDSDPSKYHDFLDRIETNLLERATDDAEDMVDKQGLVKKTLQEYYASDSKNSNVEFTQMSDQDLGKWLIDNKQDKNLDTERVQEIAGNKDLYKSHQNVQKIKPTNGKKSYGSLVLAKDAEVQGMVPSTANRMMAMADEYNRETGDTIQVNSGYRSFEKQAELYKTMPKGKAARPGNSMHNFGVAFDAQSEQMNKADKLGLLDKYGFHRPIKSKEPWHVEDATVDRVALRKQGQSAYAEMIAKTAPVAKLESDSEMVASNDESYTSNHDPKVQRKIDKARARAERMRENYEAKQANNSKTDEVEALNNSKSEGDIQRQATTNAMEIAKANAPAQAAVVNAVKTAPSSIAAPSVDVDVDMSESNAHLGTQTQLLQEISTKLGNLAGNVFTGDSVQQTNVNSFQSLANDNNVPNYSNKGLNSTSVKIARNG